MVGRGNWPMAAGGNMRHEYLGEKMKRGKEKERKLLSKRGKNTLTKFPAAVEHFLAVLRDLSSSGPTQNK